MLDLSKIRIPAGTVRLEIDDPENCRIKKAAGCIRGWFAAGKIRKPVVDRLKIAASP